MIKMDKKDNYNLLLHLNKDFLDDIEQTKEPGSISSHFTIEQILSNYDLKYNVSREIHLKKMTIANIDTIIKDWHHNIQILQKKIDEEKRENKSGIKCWEQEYNLWLSINKDAEYCVWALQKNLEDFKEQMRLSRSKKYTHDDLKKSLERVKADTSYTRHAKRSFKRSKVGSLIFNLDVKKLRKDPIYRRAYYLDFAKYNYIKKKHELETLKAELRYFKERLETYDTRHAEILDKKPEVSEREINLRSLLHDLKKGLEKLKKDPNFIHEVRSHYRDRLNKMREHFRKMNTFLKLDENMKKL